LPRNDGRGLEWLEVAGRTSRPENGGSAHLREGNRADGELLRQVNLFLHSSHTNDIWAIRTPDDCEL
jgi:hypothetical protein